MKEFDNTSKTFAKILERKTKIFIFQVLYTFTSVWVLHIPNAGQNGHFQRFLC